MIPLSDSSLSPVLPLWSILILVLVTAFFSWLRHWPGRGVRVEPMRASLFAPDLVPPQIDTIVIGSGSGGCAAANLLAQSGQRVLLLEQHYRTGGCTHTFREEVSCC